MRLGEDSPRRLISALRNAGILGRSVAVTLAVFVLASIGSIAYTVYSTSEHTRESSVTRLDQLLDTVQSTVRIACFLKDKDLAKEVSLGLLSNTEVLRVTILAGNKVLADEQRDGTIAKSPSNAVDLLRRPIVSPFKANDVVGEVRLTPNPEVIARQLRTDVFLAATQLLWQLTLVSSAIVISLMMFVIRPISTMSSQLHQMDPAAGDRVTIPPGHTGTEIGQLAKDVNELADHLVDALNEEHALRLQREVDERKYHAIFDNAESGIFIVDGAGMLSSWNPAFSRLLGVSQMNNHVGALSFADFLWEDPELIMRLLQRCLRENAPVVAELAIPQADGVSLWLSVVLSPVGGGLLQGVVHDVSSLKEAEASARRQAVTDPLTGLANRAGLEDRLRAHVSRQTLTQAGSFALMIVNLDKFRHIVEGIGLPASDEILKTVARRLSATIKHDDTVARMSADIFGLVLPNLTDGDAVYRVIERIMESLRQPYMVDGSPISLYASIGITLFPSDGTDVPTLLRHAELAVDKAKAAGNTSVFFDPTLAEAAEQRRYLENDLRGAVRNNDFVLFYQPIVDLRDNRLVGAEALIRWRHPEHGLVSPDRFIPVAEQTGLINDIGQWVVDSACRQLLAWQQAGLDYCVSLNVSGRQIPEGLSPAKVAEALSRHRIAPSRLALEITEGVLLSDIDQALQWLTALRNLGVRIYMDDFGTGYSSLAYLKRFPVDTLKVDKSFVMDMHKNDSDRHLVEGIVAMAHSLGLPVVAEGVEAASHVEMLRAMGCRYAQGYYFSRPLPAEDFAIAAERIAMLGAANSEPVVAN
jgi:diguanylate cyclase (GGDEF)-like protein/PAS domain S-box-containing protein